MKYHTRFSLLTIMVLGLLSACSSKKVKPPNILFCIADDATYMHFGAYGCDWVETPAFDKVAQQGILFMNAYTPNAKCAPSRACILTGRNSWQLEEAGNHWPYFPDKFKTYAEVLTENGYHVGFTAKGYAPGIVGEINGKPRELTGKRYSDIKLESPTNHISNVDYSANFKAFLNDNENGKPFCFWYGSTEPHRRYEFGSGIEKAGKSVDQVDKVPAFWPDVDTVRTDMLDYAFEIEWFDKHLVNMLQILEERGELDNTIVIVTADNGMPFPRVKGQAYEYSNHLPLAVMWKNGIINPGRIVEDFVSFIDFAPTFLELAGVNGLEKGMQPITGKSITDILYSEKSGKVNAERNSVLIGKERHDIGRPNDWGYPVRGIVTEEYIYLHNFETDRWPAGNPETGYLNTDGSATKTFILNQRRQGEDIRYWQWAFGKRPSEELYRVADDPECMNNLANEEAFEEIIKGLKNQLFERLKQEEDPRMFGQGHVFDEYEYADKSGVGFYEKYMRGEDLNWGWVNDTDFEKQPIE
jgi:N-sulfoglucosamine sulfohydrolase